MILTELFPGDSFRIAKIQNKVYNKALGIIYLAAKERYRHAEAVLDITTELSKLLTIKSFDHRTIQWFHDSLAGQFRFNYCCYPDLFEEPVDQQNEEDDINERWLSFLHRELETLFEQFINLPHLILTAIIYANPDPRGTKAEDKLYKITVNHYRDVYSKIDYIDD